MALYRATWLVVIMTLAQGCALITALSEEPEGSDAPDQSVVDMSADDSAADLDEVDQGPADMDADMGADMGEPEQAYMTIQQCLEGCVAPRQCVLEEGASGAPYRCIGADKVEERCLDLAPMEQAMVPDTLDELAMAQLPPLYATPAAGGDVAAFVRGGPSAEVIVFADDAIERAALGASLHGDPTPEGIFPEALISLPGNTPFRLLALGRSAGPGAARQVPGVLYGALIAWDGIELGRPSTVTWTHTLSGNFCPTYPSNHVLSYDKESGDYRLAAMFCNTSRGAQVGQETFELDGADHPLPSDVSGVTLTHQAKIELSDVAPANAAPSVRDVVVSAGAGGGAPWLWALHGFAEAGVQRLYASPLRRASAGGGWEDAAESIELDMLLHGSGAGPGKFGQGCGDAARSRLVLGPDARGLIRATPDGKLLQIALPFRIDPSSMDDRIKTPRWAIVSVKLDATNPIASATLRCVSADGEAAQRDVIDMVSAAPGGVSLLLQRDQLRRPDSVRLLLPQSGAEATLLRSSFGTSPLLYIPARLVPAPQERFHVLGWRIFLGKAKQEAAIFRMRINKDGAPMCKAAQ